MSGPAARTLQDEMRDIEALVETLERQAEPAARAAAQQLVQALLAFHRAGLARLLAAVRQSADGQAVLAAAARDDLVGNLLLLHGLHPVGPEARVRQALDRVQPLLGMDGTVVQLLGVIDGVATVRLETASPASVQAVRKVLEGVISEAAPDVTAVVFEGPEGNEPTGRDGRIALPLVGERR